METGCAQVLMPALWKDFKKDIPFWGLHLVINKSIPKQGTPA
jgi:hypothetical protein